MAQLTLSNRILTLTDTSGTSSVDLSTIKGDDGPRGPQGPAGIVAGGSITQDMSNYYTKSEVDTLIENIDADVDVDLTGYATEIYVQQQVANINIPTVPTKVSAFANDAGYLTETTILRDYYTKTQTDAITSGLASEAFVTTKIAEAQLGGGSGSGDIDLSGFATKDEIPTKTSQLTNDSNFATKEEITEAVGGINLSGYLPKDGSVPMTGRLTIQSGDGLWLDDSGSSSNLYMNFDRSNNCAAIYSDGDIAFTVFDKRIIAVATPVKDTDVANKNYVDTAIANAIAALDGSEVPY